MILSAEHILALQSLKGFGTASLEKVLAYDVLPLSSDPSDLLALLDEMISNRSLSRVKLPTIDDVAMAFDRAVDVVGRSRELGIGVVTRQDKDFPRTLLSTVDDSGRPSVPALLFYRGEHRQRSRPRMRHCCP